MTKDRRRGAMDHEKKKCLSQWVAFEREKRERSRPFFRSAISTWPEFHFRAAASFFLSRLLFEFIAAIPLPPPTQNPFR